MRKIKVRDLLQNASGSACPALASVSGRLGIDAGGWKTCADRSIFFKQESIELRTHKATEDTEFTETCGISCRSAKTDLFFSGSLKTGRKFYSRWAL